MLIHANWAYLEPGYHGIHTWIWHVEVFLNIVTRYSVPAFVMISGAFILKSSRSESIEEFYKHSLIKIFIPGGVVILIIAIVKAISNISSREAITNGVIGILTGSTYGLWYMHMLLGLYFLVPFIYRVKKNTTKIQYYSFAVILMVWSAFSQAVNTPRMAGSMSVVFPFSAFFIMGDIIYTIISKIKGRKIISIASAFFAVVFVIITYIFRVKTGSERYLSNAYTCFFSPTIIAFSICVFTFFGSISIKANLNALANKSFYAYLFHYPILIILKSWCDRIGVNDLFRIIILTLVTIVLSYFASYVFDRIYYTAVKRLFRHQTDMKA